MIDAGGLQHWSAFYSITAESSATLTGLVFVVVSLLSRSRLTEGRESRHGFSNFISPTIAHFGAALLLSALVAAPWYSLIPPSFAIGGIGAIGLGNSARIIVRTAKLAVFNPGLKNWVFHAIAPLFAYGAITVSGFLLMHAALAATYLLASCILALMFIGIRNSWDVVTYLAFNTE